MTRSRSGPPYIGGLDIVWHTDHEALIWLATQPKLSKKQASWLRTLCEFPIELKYLPGKLNPAADALSRLQLMQTKDEKETTGSLYMSVCTMKTAIPREEWETAYMQDDKLRKEWELPVGAGVYRKAKGLLWRAYQVVVPESLQQRVLTRYHEACHLGETKTEGQIRRRFVWKGMQKQVRKAVRECPVCQVCKAKRTRKRGLLRPLSMPRQKWTSLGIDFLCGIPICGNYNMIMVVVDRLTKMAHFIPCTTALTAQDCARLLKTHVFKHHGIPGELVSDRDPRFTSHFWEGLLEVLNIGSLKSTANHPQTDGQTERVNGSMVNLLRCWINERDGTNWLEGLDEVEMTYNASPHTKTGHTPFFLNYGYEPVLPHEDPDWVAVAVDKDAKEYVDRMNANLRVAKQIWNSEEEAMKKYADKFRRLGPAYKVGDCVLLESDGITHVPQGKLAPCFVGPLKVIEVLPGGAAFRLDLPPGWSRMSNSFNEAVLRPYYGMARVPELPSRVLGGQSPCIGTVQEAGRCAATDRVIARCGFCNICHRRAMETYGLPMKCLSYVDHRVELPPNFVPAVPPLENQEPPEPEQMVAPPEPATVRGARLRSRAPIPEHVLAALPPSDAPNISSRQQRIAQQVSNREQRRLAREQREE